MKAAIALVVFSLLVIGLTEANFYGKRGNEGKSLKDILHSMRSMQSELGAPNSAEAVLFQIDQLIQQYKAAQAVEPEN